MKALVCIQEAKEREGSTPRVTRVFEVHLVNILLCRLRDILSLPYVLCEALLDGNLHSRFSLFPVTERCQSFSCFNCLIQEGSVIRILKVFFVYTWCNLYPSSSVMSAKEEFQSYDRADWAQYIILEQSTQHRNWS